jgi:hypothetical protein
MRGRHTEVGAWELGSTRTWCCPDAWAPPWRHTTYQFPTPCERSSWRHARASGSDESRNAALFSHATPDVSSRPTLRHSNPVRNTQVHSTNDAYLCLGPNVADLAHTQAGWVTHKRARRRRQVLGMNNANWTRGGPKLYYSSALLRCLLTDIDYERTSHFYSTVALICIPLLPFTLASIKWRGEQPSQGLTNRTPNTPGTWARYPLPTSL